MTGRVLIVNGSPRKNGNTKALLTQAAKLAEEAGYSLDYTDLIDLDIKPCRGCLRCKERGSCIQMDDMTELYKKIKEADIVLMGSPIYFGDSTGLFKTFFDRWYALLSYSERRGMMYEGKLDLDTKIAFVFTSGSIEGHILYHAVSIRYAGSISNLFQLMDVTSTIVPRKKNEEDIMKSPQAHEFLEIFGSQL